MSEKATADVIAFDVRHRMTPDIYDVERDTIRATYGDKRSDAAAKYDQAMAALFYRSGWTQEELAAKEGKSQSWVDYHMRFGRFLNFTTTVVNSELPVILTERSFRTQWENTKGDERDRFRIIAGILAEAKPRLFRKPRQPIGPAIVEKFADGKWHRPEIITKAINADLDHVMDSLENMLTRGVFKTKIERRNVGVDTAHGYPAGFQYCIHRREQTVSVDELIRKLSPLVGELNREARRPPGTGGGAIIGGIAQRIQNLLDAWGD